MPVPYSTGHGPNRPKLGLEEANIYINALKQSNPSRGSFLVFTALDFAQHMDLLDVSREHATDSISDSVKRMSN